MADYGPASYVPGDRYDEYGEGRGSASNSDQTGTLSRASYHSSDPEHYPDLLDIPNRMKQPSPGSVAGSMLYGHIGGHPHMMPPPPIGPDGQILHHGHGPPMVLHPGHLMSPPHPHVISPFQRTGTLPHNFSMGTLPHQHPRSVSCDHSNAGAGYGPIIQTTQGARPGYVTLPRRPRGSWAGHQPRDTPSPALSVSMSGARDPIYDGVGPRTSATGSSVTNLNKSVDNAIIPAFKSSVGSRYQPTLPPLIPPIKEEAGHLHQPGLPKSNPNILNMSEPNSVTGANTKRSPLSRLLTSGSASTLNGGGEEENLSAYFEPFGSALVPCAPGNRDSIASCESDSLLIKEEKKEAADCDKEAGVPSPRSLTNGHTHNGHSPPLPAIPELEPVNDHSDVSTIKKQPPPTLPKPKKVTKVTPPAPPPKPKLSNGTALEESRDKSSFQDETFDGSEV